AATRAASSVGEVVSSAAGDVVEGRFIAVRRYHSERELTRRRHREHLQEVHGWLGRAVNCVCDLQAGRFRKQKARGCGRSRCLVCHYENIPLTTSWYLADLGEARGKQELFTRQSPQKLKVLREHAIVESAVSSNRIEGVQIDQARVGTVVFGKSRLRDREEEEIRGYRD